MTDTKVYYKHFRYIDGSASNPNYLQSDLLWNDRSARGGITLAVADVEGFLHYDIAVCTTDDAYEKAVGRQLSLARLTTAIENGVQICAPQSIKRFTHAPALRDYLGVPVIRMIESGSFCVL